MSLMREAIEQETDILLATRDNWASIRDSIHINEESKREIDRCLESRDKCVLLPSAELEHFDWTGIGYVLLDTTTGSGTYRISGGQNGGTPGWVVSALFAVDMMMYGADMIQIANGISAMLCMASPITCTLGVVMLSVSLVLTIRSCIEAITNMIEYTNGNTEAGDAVVMDAGLNVFTLVAVTGGTSVAREGSKRMTRKFLAGKMGEEATEKLLKSEVSNATIVRSVKNLNKAGLTDNVISDIINVSGAEGMVKLSNAARMISAHGDDAIKAINNRITPRQMEELLKKDIAPGDYEGKNIVDFESAKRVIEGGSVSRGTLIGKLDKLTKDERGMIEYLLSSGKNVEIIPRSNTSKTPDFFVDGVKTELKTLNGSSLNTPLTRIEDGFEQGAEVVIIDGRKTELTLDQANTLIKRALGKYGGKLPGIVEIWTTEGIIRR